MPEFVGKNIKREDAYDKALGKALYPDDIEFEGMLYAGAVRASIPYGRVKSVNIEEIKKQKGVVEVIDYKMIPGERKHGVVLKDQPFLVEDIFKRVGDPIVVIVAENKTALRNAIKAASG